MQAEHNMVNAVCYETLKTKVLLMLFLKTDRVSPSVSPLQMQIYAILMTKFFSLKSTRDFWLWLSMRSIRKWKYHKVFFKFSIK